MYDKIVEENAANLQYEITGIKSGSAKTYVYFFFKKKNDSL